VRRYKVIYRGDGNVHVDYPEPDAQGLIRIRYDLDLGWIPQTITLAVEVSND
jgi:hypothetical protein